VANRWTKFPMQLVKGIDTKTDDLLGDQLLAVENGVMTLQGQVAKRNGYERLASGLRARKLAVLDEELVALDGAKLWSWSDQRAAFVERGDLPCCGVHYRALPGDHTERTQGDSATVGGVRVVAWEDSGPLAVRYQVIDEVSGATLAGPTTIATSKMPRVVAVGDRLFVVYVSTAHLAIEARVINPADLDASLAAPAVELASNVRHSAEPSYDVRAYGPRQAILAYTEEAGADFFVLRVVRQDGSIAYTTAYAKDDPLEPDTVVVTCCATGANTILVAWSDPANCWATQFDATGGSIVGVFNFLASPAARMTCTGVDPSTSVDDGGATSTIDGTRSAYVWVEVAGASPADSKVTAYQWIEAQGTASPIATVVHARLFAHAFDDGIEAYALVVYDSSIQPTVALMRGRGHSVASSVYRPFFAGYVLLDEAGGTPYSLVTARATPNLPGVYRRADAGVDVVGVYRTRLQSIPTTSTGAGLPDQVNPVFTERGLKLITFDFAAVPSVAKVGRHLTISGAQPWLYDGGMPVEHNFVLFTEKVAIADGGAGLLPAGTRSYRVYPEWTNARGELERGHCVGTFLWTNAGSKKVVLTIQTMGLTNRQGARGNVSFAVYRTVKDAFATTPHQRVSSLDPATASADNGWVYNDPAANSVTFTDNMVDADLAQHEVDYEFDGTLENVAPQSGRIVFGGHDRLFVTGLEDPNLILPSKLHFDGELVAFNDGIQLRTDEEGGAITAGALLDNTLVAFKADRIYTFDGTGPDNTGQDDTYGPAQLVAADVGCVEPESIVVYSAGVAFKSKKGYYLLDRGRGVVYLGAAVEAYNAQAVTAAVLAPATNRIVVFTADVAELADGRAPTTLALDTYWNQWTRWKNFEATSAVLWRDRIVFATPDGRVVRETPGAYSDDGVFVKLAIETPWYGVAGIQGWQAVRAIGLLGHYVGAHGLRVSTQYDYEAGFRFRRDWDPQTVINQSVYGSVSPYGSGGYGGSGSRNYQCFYGLKIQKCEAVRFRIEDVPVKGVAPTAGFVLSSIVLEAAVHGGLVRPANARRVQGPNSGTVRAISGGDQ
jgi:hypothetical protein